MGSVGSRTHSNSNFGYSRPYGVPAHLHENSMYRDGQPSQFYSLPIGVPVQKGFGVRAGAGGIGTGKNMHITPPVGGYFDSDSLYNPIHLGGMGYYPMEYEYDNWMGRIGNGGASAQNLPLRF